jgi:hypothetical protein
MAYGAYSHNRIQLGRETTPGTAVPATVVWRGRFANIEDRRTRVVVEEEVGILVNAERSYTSGVLAGLAMPATEMTFEQLPHILEAGIGTVTPTGANPYVYTYTMPTGNTVNTIKTYTIEAYNVIGVADYREMAYSFVESFSLTGAAGEAWMMSADWLGRIPVTGTPTAALTPPTVEDVLFPKTKLYIDASGGTIGTTQVTGVLMGAEINVTTGLVVVPVGDGNLYFAAHKFVRPEVTFSITMELEQTASNSRVATERGISETDSVRLIRLSTEGSTASRKVVIDLAGKYDLPSGTYENANGNTTATFSGRAVYSSADALFMSIAVTNTLSALP